MVSKNNSFLSIDDLGQKDIQFILDTARLYKKEFEKQSRIIHCINSEMTRGKVVQLLFSEPSTRTRASFEVACGRLGIQCTSIWNLHHSSMAKGETLLDTFQSLVCLRPDLIVVRIGEFKSAEQIMRASPVPIVNAGLGVTEHPTQALVDVFTIKEKRGKVNGENILLVGDVLYSRVANSNLKLLTRLGAKMGICGPKELSPVDHEDWKNVERFESLEEGIKWAHVLMCLRVQRERHSLRNIGFSIAEYRDKYRIDKEEMDIFRPDGVLLHPGPVVRGVEISSRILEDKRCHILSQVEHGMHVRAAVLSHMLDLKVGLQ